MRSPIVKLAAQALLVSSSMKLPRGWILAFVELEPEPIARFVPEQVVGVYMWVRSAAACLRYGEVGRVKVIDYG